MLYSTVINDCQSEIDTYAEMIETIVETDIRCANNKSISPIMRSGAYMTLGMLSAAKEEYYSSENSYLKLKYDPYDFSLYK